MAEVLALIQSARRLEDIAVAAMSSTCNVLARDPSLCTTTAAPLCDDAGWGQQV